MYCVFVGKLNYKVREKDVEKLFRSCGRIIKVMIKYGYGFVLFEDQRDADTAIRELDGKEFFGSRIVVEHTFDSQRRISSRNRFDTPLRTEYKLTVENLSSRITWQDLKDVMRHEGHDVIYATAHTLRKNEGLIEFASYRQMKRALKEFDGIHLNGRKVKLREFWARSSSRGKSASRSRSSSRRVIRCCHANSSKGLCQEESKNCGHQDDDKIGYQGDDKSPCHDDQRSKKHRRNECLKDEDRKNEEREEEMVHHHGDDDDARGADSKQMSKDQMKKTCNDKIYYLCVTSRPPDTPDQLQTGMFAFKDFIDKLKEQSIRLERRSWGNVNRTGTQPLAAKTRKTLLPRRVNQMNDKIYERTKIGD